MRLVLDNKLDDILKHHRSADMSVVTVLEYSAKRGRHAITQALVAEGVTVTQTAITAAAKLGGIGVDILLAGVVPGEQLEMAQHDALYARIYYGEFARAIEMLENGVKPSEHCYRAIDVGMKRRQRGEDALERAHSLLDAMIPATPADQFTLGTLESFLPIARPIHIERTLEIVKRPPSFIFAAALRSKADAAVETLRQLGMRIDDYAFAQIRDDLISRYVPQAIAHALLSEYVKDNGQTMPAALAEPLLLNTLVDRSHLLFRITGPSDDSYKLASEVLLPYVNAVAIEEHLQLFKTIDRWALQSRTPVPPQVTAVLKHTIQAANRIANERLIPCESPAP